MKALCALAVVALAVGCGDTTLLATAPYNSTEKAPETKIPVFQEEDFQESEPLLTTLPMMPPLEFFAPLPQTIQADLRMRGSNQETFHAALLRSKNLRIVADGVDLEYTLHNVDMDVAMSGHAWKFASFEVPAGVRFIQVLLEVDPEEGSFVSDTAEGQLTAPGIPIYFEATTEMIARRNKVVLDLDLGRSLVETAVDIRELVPVYRVDY